MRLHALTWPFLALTVAAEDGSKAWLRYAPVRCNRSCQKTLPSHITILNANKTSPIFTAAEELQDGLHGIAGKHVAITRGCNAPPSSILVATVSDYLVCNGTTVPDDVLSLDEDGFYLHTHGASATILGQNARGALYGAFEYLSLLAQGDFATLSNTSQTSNPHAPIRWVNQWDNMDGSIERGYAGPSIFFASGKIVDDLSRAREYARLLASVRINAIIVNNVNANATLLSAENMDGLARLADVMRSYGVAIGISLNFASPQTFGGLDTYDPLDESVIAWWENVTDELYARIPDLAGYLVKASSEGQPGPDAYNRTLAEGANLFARALQPHGGVLMFRAFVYDHHISEEHWKNDRANAAVDFFKPLDGKFEENVIVQIKYGPIDFQVREPVSPLFANLRKTNVAIELQVTQEYLGQQDHLVYLPPLWKTITDFDLRVDNASSPVRDIISGEHFSRPLGGWAAVVNVGTNTTWLGSHLALSNLYAYGRLAWDPTLDPETILDTWTRLTFSAHPRVLETVNTLSMTSWPAYENYTGNLGIQTLTDILYTHYGPNPASQDGNGWGQWMRADGDTIGMDRTVWNGTGFSGQYPAQVASVYEDLDTTPDDLLLWFHHVPYTYVLKSEKSVIQHFYDAHYAGAQAADAFVDQWDSLKPLVDKRRFEEIRRRFVYQAGHAVVWRDAVTSFYHNLSGIADQHDRVGHHPWRIEAEDMTLDGYVRYTVSPFETASRAFAVVTETNSTTGSASATVPFADGVYDLVVNYYDLYGGHSQWKVYLNEKLVGSWKGDMEDTLGHNPSIYIDGHSATRIRFRKVKVRTGDKVRIVGVPDGTEPAPLDYVAFLPRGIVD
ncbi:putative alpha-glucuronidase A [Aspergillus pseudoustus]|uniref:Alpha-glucuronidase n=1 Tax=Aspergillus pseudoustus TaxID=1810923 RepID=A0ABR4J6T6_9EURO